MFEVEKKFILSAEDIKRLTAGAGFLGEQIFEDVYFDTSEFALTKNDMWLRSRNGKFGLKIPKHLQGGKLSQQYQEIEGEENLRQIFALNKQGSFLDDIAGFGYVSFCALKTTRKKFRKENFVLDLDEVEAEEFQYVVGEIELMVENENEMADALVAIEKFSTQHGLKNELVPGKVWEYLKKKRPAHYRVLVEVGVVTEGEEG